MKTKLFNLKSGFAFACLITLTTSVRAEESYSIGFSVPYGKNCVSEVALKWEAFRPLSTFYNPKPFPKLCQNRLGYGGFPLPLPPGNLDIGWSGVDGKHHQEALPIRSIFERAGVAPGNIEVLVTNDHVEIWNSAGRGDDTETRAPIYSTLPSQKSSVWQVSIHAHESTKLSPLRNFQYRWGALKSGDFERMGRYPRTTWASSVAAATIYDEAVPTEPFWISWTDPDGQTINKMLDIAGILKGHTLVGGHLELEIHPANLEVWLVEADPKSVPAGPNFFVTKRNRILLKSVSLAD